MLQKPRGKTDYYWIKQEDKTLKIHLKKSDFKISYNKLHPNYEIYTFCSLILLLSFFLKKAFQKFHSCISAFLAVGALFTAV